MAKAFGDILRELRVGAGIGLRKFAVLVGERPENISNIEHGRRPGPQSPERLRVMADVLGLTEGDANWDRFFDAAKRPGQLPADVEHMANRKMVPALLRTIDGMRLTNNQLEELVNYLNYSWRDDKDGAKGTAHVFTPRNRAKGKRSS